MSPSVIAIIGQAGAGKTTIANYLMLHDHYVRVRFTEILKGMLLSMGLSKEEVDGELKDKPCSLLLGKTPRYAMQTLGVEWGRGLIHPNIWVHAWKVRVKEQLSLGHKVVCDDCRFRNEVQFVRTFNNAKIWEVRRKALPTMEHSSEGGLKDYRADGVFLNYSTVEDLETLVRDVVKKP